MPTLGLLALAFGWDATGLDLAVMHLFADGQGFPLRSHPLFEHWLHDQVRNLGWVVFLMLLVTTFTPRGPLLGLERARRVEAMIGVVLCLLVVNQLKRMSLTSCPWDLAEFGGVARYVSHWAFGASDGGGGHCFPGGHSSAALGFLPLAMPWLLAAETDRRRVGTWLALLIIGLGIALGAVQTVRGAHYPSHTLWTVVLCWLLAVANHLAFRAVRQRRAVLPASA